MEQITFALDISYIIEKIVQYVTIIENAAHVSLYPLLYFQYLQWMKLKK